MPLEDRGPGARLGGMKRLLLVGLAVAVLVLLAVVGAAASLAAGRRPALFGT